MAIRHHAQLGLELPTRHGAEARPAGPAHRRSDAHGPGPDEHAQDREAAAFVQAFVATLDEDKRALFFLALLEEIPIPEVAATLGIPLNTAYTRVRRLRLEFQQALAKRETAA